MNINLLDHFENTVSKNRNRISVKHKEESITFAELESRAKIVGGIITDIVPDA